jgi:four helix bundle protein
MEKKEHSDFRRLLAYKKTFELAMEIFHISKLFPKEEKYSLTDQIRRSSRSVCTNLAEGYKKRIYPALFLLKISDCLGENSETQVWLEFAFSCEYIDNLKYQELCLKNDEIGKLLLYMYNNSEKFGVIKNK